MPGAESHGLFFRAPTAISSVGEGMAKGASHFRLPQKFSHCGEWNFIQSCHYLTTKRKLLSLLCEGTNFLGYKREKRQDGYLRKSANATVAFKYARMPVSTLLRLSFKQLQGLPVRQ